MTDMFASPATTTFDAVTTALTAAAYLVVALAAILHAPRDARTRLFLAVALLNLGPAAGSVVLWREGPQATFSPLLVMLLAVTTLEGSLAIFHFAQVFPRRRPWILRHGRWLFLGYVVVLLAAAGLGWGAPRSVDELSVEYGVVALAVGLPVVGMVGVFIPLAGLVSLYKSYLETRAAGETGASQATYWILISQLAGGILAAIVLPLLHMLAVPVVWTTAASALFFAFGILMPIAFAAGIWKLGVLRPQATAAPH